jgi:4-diphosphocytidyl-2-C-methyl-D-erythritol kinase
MLPVPVGTLKLSAPAKINLFLAVTGARGDGYHDLLSVAAKLTLADTLAVDPADGGFTLECDTADIPVDGTNLVLKAAGAFAAATGWKGGARFRLEKRIPFGAGLGGASSDAVCALRALNTLSGGLLDEAGLARVAAAVGSDCPLFLKDGPIVMRGRGEQVESLPKEAYARFRGMRILLFKPGFPIPTPWAYGRLAAEAPRSYVPRAEAEAMLAGWLTAKGAPVDRLLFNSMERAAFSKYAALPQVIGELRERFQLLPRMSGSGSACFAILNEDAPFGPLESHLRGALGQGAFVVETRLA